MKKLKHLNKRFRNKVIENKKKQLISKIEQCKKLSELEGWSKTMDYHPVLSKDYDWDFGFFIELIRFKLKRMSNYFHTHNIIENEDRLGVLCDKAVSILDAAYSGNIVTIDELDNIYVNTRNVHRFLKPKELDFITKENLSKYYLPTLREAKAKKLFWKFIEHYIEYLWD